MRNIIVIRCEHHRNDWLVGNVKRLELLRWLRIGEVDALQLLEFPVGADPLVMHEIDVQQAFGKVTWRAQRLLAVRAVIGVFVEFLENREHPFTIIEEDLLLHNEHIAEARLIAVEEILCVLLIVGIHIAQNLIAALQIVIMQQGSGLPQSTRTSILVDDFIQIAKWSCDDIVLSDYAGDIIIVQTVFLRSLDTDIVIHDFSERVFLMHGFGKIEIAAIMAESVIIRVNVLPRPVLGGQFAVTWIAI